MTLAQVVYNMSTDTDFAHQLFANPEQTLQKRGLKISKEELAFLLTAPTRGEREKSDIVALSDVRGTTWRG